MSMKKSELRDKIIAIMKGNPDGIDAYAITLKLAHPDKVGYRAFYTKYRAVRYHLDKLFREHLAERMEPQQSKMGLDKIPYRLK